MLNEKICDFFGELENCFLTNLCFYFCLHYAHFLLKNSADQIDSYVRDVSWDFPFHYLNGSAGKDNPKSKMPTFASCVDMDAGNVSVVPKGYSFSVP